MSPLRQISQRYQIILPQKKTIAEILPAWLAVTCTVIIGPCLHHTKLLRAKPFRNPTVVIITYLV